MQLVAATTRPNGSPSFAYHHDGAKGGDGDEPRGSRMSQEDSSWSQIVNLYSQVSSRGMHVTGVHTWKYPLQPHPMESAAKRSG